MNKIAFNADEHQPQTFTSTDLNKAFFNPDTPGKHRFTIMVDGDLREYYLHIPKGYNCNAALPVVFMLHGSGSNGAEFYSRSGWKEEGEKKNIFTVFPSSWKYDCVFDDGVQKHHAEKWTSYDLVLCHNKERRDDVKFLSTVIDDLKRKLNVDEKRIYMAGFSSGGEMAARCAIELSDKLAAVVACAGSLPPDTTLVPSRKLPVLLQIGAADPRLLQKLGSTSPLPLNINKVLSNYPFIQSNINSYLKSFLLSKNYITSGSPGKYSAALFPGSSGNQENVLKFVVVKGLTHQYSNGQDHPLESAAVHWKWMKNFKLL